MTAIENLILDFKTELKMLRFRGEEQSYQYIVNVVDIAYKLDKSVPKFKIMRLINDASVSLEEAYTNVIEFLEGLK